uniref:Secreted protein n=1 Tax=Arundo donax TaxID=35708 RepID=A0A0A9CMD3_ARUDO
MILASTLFCAVALLPASSLCIALPLEALGLLSWLHSCTTCCAALISLLVYGSSPSSVALSGSLASAMVSLQTGLAAHHLPRHLSPTFSPSSATA